MNFPIVINSWQDWLDFKKRIYGLTTFTLNENQYTGWISYTPKLLWKEVKDENGKVIKDVNGKPLEMSEIVPFKITWLDFKFSTKEHAHAYIYVTPVI